MLESSSNQPLAQNGDSQQHEGEGDGEEGNLQIDEGQAGPGLGEFI